MRDSQEIVCACRNWCDGVAVKSYEEALQKVVSSLSFKVTHK